MITNKIQNDNNNIFKMFEDKNQYKSKITIPENWDIYEIIEELYKSNVGAKGIRTGVNLIDKKTGGLYKGTLNTIMGFAGHGKTTFRCKHCI